MNSYAEYIIVMQNEEKAVYYILIDFLVILFNN